MKNAFLLFFLLLTLTYLKAQTIVSIGPNFGYLGHTTNLVLTTSNVINTSSHISSVYLWRGVDTLVFNSVSIGGNDICFLTFSIPAFSQSGPYDFYINVDSVEYTCSACFSIAPRAGQINGSVFFDLDEDGMWQPEEPFVPNSTLSLTIGNSNSVVQYIDVPTGEFTNYPIGFPTYYNDCYFTHYVQDSAQAYSPTAVQTSSFCVNNGVIIYGIHFGLTGSPGRIHSINPGQAEPGDTIQAGLIQMDSLLSFGAQAWGNIEQVSLYGPQVIHIPVQNLTIISPTEVSIDFFVDTAISLGSYSLLMKISSQLYTCTNCFLVQDSLSVSSSNRIEQNPESISIYPNPFDKKARVDFSNFTSNQYYIQMIDYNGRIVRNIRTNNTKIELERENLVDGLYLLRVCDQAGSELGIKRISLIRYE
ncbi:MAG: T9SS type A sorting domain-containing protein [Bacteroidetes bacterium]|nr:MAG: T9SS type A sorting domain-containing protein [Bacteroidota bacterium]